MNLCQHRNAVNAPFYTPTAAQGVAHFSAFVAMKQKYSQTRSLSAKQSKGILD